MSNYSLQKYKGTSTRHTCPNCGDRRSFAYYVDESGTPLHPSVGRCNHESGCGYHYTPKQYFHDHPECRTAGGFSSGRQCMAQKPKQPLQQTAIGYIPPHYVEKSQSVHSNFCRFLSVLLDSYYGSKAKEMLERLMEDYRLGATRDGAVIWQSKAITSKEHQERNDFIIGKQKEEMKRLDATRQYREHQLEMANKKMQETESITNALIEKANEKERQSEDLDRAISEKRSKLNKEKGSELLNAAVGWATGKSKALKNEIEGLRYEISTHEETIERLQDKIHHTERP